MSGAVTITAQVVLFTPEGKSLLSEQIITAANIAGLKPTDDSIIRASNYFGSIGFRCYPSVTTLTIEGPLTLFEHTFHLKFEKTTLGRTSYYAPIGAAHIPDAVAEVVADVVFPEPVQSFV